MKELTVEYKFTNKEWIELKENYTESEIKKFLKIGGQSAIVDEMIDLISYQIKILEGDSND